MTDEHDDRDDPAHGEQMMDDEQMTAAEASRLASIGHLLADSTIWMEPAPELEQAVLAAIRRDATPVAPPSAPSSDRPPPSNPP